jgi:hypothetical protein
MMVIMFVIVLLVFAIVILTTGDDFSQVGVTIQKFLGSIYPKVGVPSTGDVGAASGTDL